MTDGSGATSYTYDDHDRLQTKTDASGHLDVWLRFERELAVAGVV